LAQILGILVADRGWLDARSALMLAALALVGAVLAQGRTSRAVLAALCVLGGSALHLQHPLDADARAGPLDTARDVTFQAKVVRVRHSLGGARYDLARALVLDRDSEPLPTRLRLRVDVADLATSAVLRSLVAGDHVRVRARVRPRAGVRNPGGRGDDARVARREGATVVARLLHPALVVRLPDAGPRPFAPLLRRRLRAADALASAGPAGPLLAALALGEGGRLSHEVRGAFARLGVAHLLAVSGLHLALVAAGLYTVGRPLLGRWVWLARRADTRRVALALALAAAGAQALMAGLDVPVRRAWVLLAALSAGVWLGRPTRRSAGLVVAAFVVLALEPRALFRSGAQLSFLATAALVFRGAGGGPLRASATAILATAPLVAWRFGEAAPWALAANLLTVPLVGGLLLPAALLAALSALADPTTVLVGASGIWLRWVEAAAGGLQRGAVALAQVLPPGHAPHPAALCVLAILALLGLRARRTGVRVAAALAVGAGAAWAPPQIVLPPPPRLVVLDVGQGDAVLVEGRSGALLVDAGRVFAELDRGRDVVLPALRQLGVRRLDVLAVTHSDLDHRGGIPAVLRGIQVGRVWLPHGASRDPAFAALRRVAREVGVPVHERGAGSPARRFGDLVVRPLWPPPAPSSWRGNDGSLVLQVAAPGGRVLLAGDISARAELELVRRSADLRADVLLLPHHGSRSSSTAELLDAVDANMAVISAPCHGRWDMPHPGPLRRARERGYALWSTGRDGALLVALAPRPWIRGWAPARCAFLKRPGRPVDPRRHVD
jgi:competence protein ComEC